MMAPLSSPTRFRNTSLTVAAVLFAALLACKSEKKEAEPVAAAPAATPAAAPTAAAATTTAAAATPAPAPAAAEVDVDAKGIPKMPSDTSNPPTVAEWSAAKPVNTAEGNSQAKDCEMKIVREWIKIHCEGKIKSISDQDGLPKVTGTNYFESIVLGKYADFVFRLKAGGGYKMRIHRDGNRASVFINWPGGKDRPTIVAMSQLKEGDDE